MSRPVQISIQAAEEQLSYQVPSSRGREANRIIVIASNRQFFTPAPFIPLCEPRFGFPARATPQSTSLTIMFHNLATLFPLLALSAITATAQVALPAGGFYTADFNTLPSASVWWTDGTTLPGWYAGTNGTAVGSRIMVSSAGESASDYLYSFAATGTPERALGAVSSTTNTLSFAVRLANSSSTMPITSLSVGFAYEIWRKDLLTAPNTSVTLTYQKFAAHTGNIGTGSWTPVPAASLANMSAFPGGASGGIASNPPSTQTMNAEITGLSIGLNEEIWLRWTITRAATAGGSWGIGIDDLSVVRRDAGTVTAWGGNTAGQTNVPVGLSGVRSIAAGIYHSLALKNDGTLVTWGYGMYGHLAVPSGLSGVTAIAAGYDHSMALKNDGTVVAWGDNSYGRTTVPAGLSGVTAIATGEAHSMALKSDGTVVPWGRDDYGQATVPVGLSGVKAIAAGNIHSAALKSDGTVVAWGNNDYDQTNVPAGLSGVTAIAAGYYHNMALKSDGTLVIWGPNWYGQTTVPAGLSGVTAIAANGNYSVALKSDGTVVAWGDNVTVPAGLSGVTAIAAGGAHTLALLGTAPAIITQPVSQYVFIGANVTLTVVASGSQIPTYQWKKDTVDIPGATGAGYHIASVQPSDTGSYTVAVTNPAGTVTSDAATLTVNGPVVAWGGNGFDQTTVPAGLSGVAALAAGGSHSVALKGDGTVVAWGASWAGQATVPAGLSGVTAIAAGSNHSVALKSDGTVAAWGYNNYRQTTVPAGLSGVTAIAAGGDCTLALKSNGTVAVWGRNDYGQTTVPGGLSGVTALAAGAYHSVALKSDGTVVAWGYNGYGIATVPAGLSGVTAIAAGALHTVALKSNGTVVAWGENSTGGTTVPTGLSGVTAITAGSSYSVALKSDGAVVVWGYNDQIQGPAPVGLPGVTAIAAGDNHTLALVGPAAPLTFTLTFASWQASEFTPTEVPDPDISGPDADPDMDGLKNIIEFAFGLNPKSGVSLQVPQAQRIGVDFGVTFTEPARITGLTYGAEWSTTMTAGSWLSMTDTGSGGTHTFSVPTSSHSEMFMRLKVTGP
ncbi:MAG: Alpha-tubulin suppressor/Alpha-tubulin suppressor/Alpha-tubulin suppressor [Verrucomicrobia bacterium]|nr:MAG: Alpha-tubulin suppressor/Alpha-tubulin suppressor/Alpha-tubulin suppressor [Verrucomicrobiota bacterium]